MLATPSADSAGSSSCRFLFSAQASSCSWPWRSPPPGARRKGREAHETHADHVGDLKLALGGLLVTGLQPCLGSKALGAQQMTHHGKTPNRTTPSKTNPKHPLETVKQKLKKIFNPKPWASGTASAGGSSLTSSCSKSSRGFVFGFVLGLGNRWPEAIG